MSLEEFNESLSKPSPPITLSAALQGLWFDAKGDWDTAHEVVQDLNTKEGFLVHAYLHRKEGDLGNATYWYQRAGKSTPSYNLKEEWMIMVKEFLNQ